MDPIRVLIIDDDSEVCDLIKYRLTLGVNEEFDVVTMSKGFERLEALGTFKGFDCLVLDLWLTPDGILKEFPMAHKIFTWARDDNPDLPIVVFSAILGLQQRQDIEDQAEIVITKTNIDNIESVIRALIHKRRVGDKV